MREEPPDDAAAAAVVEPVGPGGRARRGGRACPGGRACRDPRRPAAETHADRAGAGRGDPHRAGAARAATARREGAGRPVLGEPQHRAGGAAGTEPEGHDRHPQRQGLLRDLRRQAAGRAARLGAGAAGAGHPVGHHRAAHRAGVGAGVGVRTGWRIRPRRVRPDCDRPGAADRRRAGRLLRTQPGARDPGAGRPAQSRPGRRVDHPVGDRRRPARALGRAVDGRAPADRRRRPRCSDGSPASCSSTPRG